MLPQEHNSTGVTEYPGLHEARKTLPKLPTEDMQMAKAIYAKELMLQEKLWRVEEKVRKKLQRGSDQNSEDERHNSGQAARGKTHAKTRLSEHHTRESVKSKEELVQERRQEDAKQLRKKQSQRNEDGIRDTQEERGRWKNRETEFVESPRAKMKGNDGVHDINLIKQKIGGLDKLRWQNVKEHTKIQGNKKDNHSGGEAGVRSKDGLEKSNEREGNIGCMRESQSRERTFREMYCSDNEEDMLQMSHPRTAHRLAKEDHRGLIFEESSLPPVSNSTYSNRPPQRELGLVDTDTDSFHLLLCKICNRKFASGRLEKHVQICKKVNQSHRKVFNSYISRTKGSAIEEFWKTHSSSKSPEVCQEPFCHIFKTAE